ncbi:hypothetical protein BB561_004640 [Smittium simulii]|uniref:GATA-type domain-containing protein n=1 Tax=Smittium simulii TaxID=133385 RepID=A0A2T9YF44_9FUNG|nr:hypothetical protein BB561_004640 [Smittium simulii]
MSETEELQNKNYNVSKKLDISQEATAGPDCSAAQTSKILKGIRFQPQYGNTATFNADKHIKQNHLSGNNSTNPNINSTSSTDKVSHNTIYSIRKNSAANDILTATKNSFLADRAIPQNENQIGDSTKYKKLKWSNGTSITKVYQNAEAKLPSIQALNLPSGVNVPNSDRNSIRNVYLQEQKSIHFVPPAKEETSTEYNQSTQKTIVPAEYHIEKNQKQFQTSTANKVDYSPENNFFKDFSAITSQKPKCMFYVGDEPPHFESSDNQDLLHERVLYNEKTYFTSPHTAQELVPQTDSSPAKTNISRHNKNITVFPYFDPIINYHGEPNSNFAANSRYNSRPSSDSSVELEIEQSNVNSHGYSNTYMNNHHPKTNQFIANSSNSSISSNNTKNNIRYNAKDSSSNNHHIKINQSITNSSNSSVSSNNTKNNIRYNAKDSPIPNYIRIGNKTRCISGQYSSRVQILYSVRDNALIAESRPTMGSSSDHIQSNKVSNPHPEYIQISRAMSTNLEYTQNQQNKGSPSIKTLNSRNYNSQLGQTTTSRFYSALSNDPSMVYYKPTKGYMSEKKSDDFNEDKTKRGTVGRMYNLLEYNQTPNKEFESSCYNCKTQNTPLWRRDTMGNKICNACGLYFKLRKKTRPVAMCQSGVRRRVRAQKLSNVLGVLPIFPILNPSAHLAATLPHPVFQYSPNNKN